jgi:hypothetical protein
MSARYDPAGPGAPAAATSRDETDPSRLWRSLDRGEDPTDGAGTNASP